MVVHVIEILDLQTGKIAKLTQEKKVREKPQTQTVESFENQQHTCMFRDLQQQQVS
jgi:ABC-type sulfate/molybdate transport systems ATPase subunit